MKHKLRVSLMSSKASSVPPRRQRDKLYIFLVEEDENVTSEQNIIFEYVHLLLHDEE
jgi:hypothetical protein